MCKSNGNGFRARVQFVLQFLTKKRFFFKFVARGVKAKQEAV